LSFAKRRKYTHSQLHTVIRQQLQYVRRNLDTTTKQIELGAEMEALSRSHQQKLTTMTELYRQQKLMHDERTHKVNFHK
jgi:hypothetical protein